MYPDFNLYEQYYSGFNNYNYRGNIPQLNNDEVITLNQAIELIRKSVGDEREDEIFYDNLIKEAPSEKDKEIIQNIRDDERKHNQILRKLYYDFTGQIIPVDPMPSETVSSTANSYKSQLEKALFGELDAVVKYRKILGTMPSGDSYTLIMAIMTDELRHASKYNFLIYNAK